MAKQSIHKLITSSRHLRREKSFRGKEMSLVEKSIRLKKNSKASKIQYTLFRTQTPSWLSKTITKESKSLIWHKDKLFNSSVMLPAKIFSKRKES